MEESTPPPLRERVPLVADTFFIGVRALQFGFPRSTGHGYFLSQMRLFAPMVRRVVQISSLTSFLVSVVE
jgi:hypothetical protein